MSRIAQNQPGMDFDFSSILSSVGSVVSSAVSIVAQPENVQYAVQKLLGRKLPATTYPRTTATAPRPGEEAPGVLDSVMPYLPYIAIAGVGYFLLRGKKRR